jgi:hypothetical protein
MRDLTKEGFNSTSPQKNFYALSERIEYLESKLNRIEDGLIDVLVKLNNQVVYKPVKQ